MSVFVNNHIISNENVKTMIYFIVYKGFHVMFSTFCPVVQIHNEYLSNIKKG